MVSVVVMMSVKDVQWVREDHGDECCEENKEAACTIHPDCSKGLDLPLGARDILG